MLRVVTAIVLCHCVNLQSVLLSSCTLPAYPDHGTYEFTSPAPGSEPLRPGDEVVQFTILRYSCEAGYQISDVVNVCGETKTWSREPYCRQQNTDRAALKPSSLPDLTSCILPPLPDNGNYSFVGDIVADKRPGDRVVQHTILRYSCQPGYSTKDSISVSVCKTGHWTKKPTCKDDSETATQGTGNAGQIGCVLPPYPKNGKYKIERLPNIRPGMVVDQFLYMKYSCDEDYDISGTSFVECGEMFQWSPIPSCHKKCHMPTSYSVNFVCRNASKEIVCEDYVPHGTEILSTCKREFDPLNDLYPIICQDGLWNEYPPICRAICGLEHPIGVELVANGNIVTKHAFPWHVGVYQAHEGRFQHACGGTILYSNLIVSAAHCFYYSNGQIEAKYFRIAAGKFYRSYDNAVDNANHWVQKREVAKIHLPESYRGTESLHQSDIALVELKTPLDFSWFVRPICFDLNDQVLNTFQLRANNTGKVAGWGLTENGTTSEELRVLRMPIIDIKQCGEEVDKYNFRGYLSSDKLCAGYTTGAAVCQGDSGGGLVFSEIRGGVEKWHLRALVSVAPVQTNQDNRTTCRFDTYSAFTEVYKHRDWMIQILRRLKLLI